MPLLSNFILDKDYCPDTTHIIMEKIERKESVDSDQKERSFLAINSLGELLPFIFIAFFFAFAVGNQPKVGSAAYEQMKPVVEMSEAAFAEEENIFRNSEELEEEVYLNTSPAETEAKILPIIESKKKNKKSIQNELPVEIERNLPRPHLPKAQAREVLPVLEISQPIEEIIPVAEKFTIIEEVDESTETIYKNSPIDEAIVMKEPDIINEKAIELLEGKEIKRLANLPVETAEMTVKLNLVPKEVIAEVIVEENIEVIAAIEETEESKPLKSLSTVNYNSSDFKWGVDNYNHGFKKSAIFTNTPDGKASYSRTDAGILLKVNDLSGINPEYGIFVEKSEDGKEFNSIGIINAENTDELFYFDSDYSFDGQHHYRFRTLNAQGAELEFGKVSVIRRASIVPVSSQVNASGKYMMILDSKMSQAISYEVEEAWGSLNGEKGTLQLLEGENTLSFDLGGDPGLYFLTVSTGHQVLELLIEKPGISPDLSFYDQEVSGKQSFSGLYPAPFIAQKTNSLSFDFYLKNGNTLIFNKGEYHSETVKIKKAKIGTLPESLQARHSDETLWFTASSNISYLHQKVPVILEHNNQEITAQINIFASKNTIRPISHFSPDGDGIQDEWRIPGIESCPNTNLMVFNDWGNLIYKTNNVTEGNIWQGQKADKDLPAGMYYYVLGEYGGWVQLER